MIKPTELRIGNSVNIINTTAVAPEFTVTAAHLCDDTNFEGIPLNEEQLFKLGFSKPNNKREDYFKGQFLIRKHMVYPSYSIPEYQGKQKQLEFVHELQNLYFALIGEELRFEE